MLKSFPTQVKPIYSGWLTVSILLLTQSVYAQDTQRQAKATLRHAPEPGFRFCNHEEFRYNPGSVAIINGAMRICKKNNTMNSDEHYSWFMISRKQHNRSQAMLQHPPLSEKKRQQQE